MRRRLLLSGSGLLAALLAVALTRGAGRSAAPPALPPSRAPAPRAGASPALAVTPRPPSRNVFRYLDEASEPGPTAWVPHAAPPETQPPPPPAVRLIGFLRREGGLKAALSIMGEIVVCAPGEQVSGYTVVSVDEEEGVRVRAPDGAEISLRSAQ